VSVENNKRLFVKGKIPDWLKRQKARANMNGMHVAAEILIFLDFTVVTVYS
jgi:hypothetical protein